MGRGKAHRSVSDLAIDCQVGRNIKTARLTAGLSQSQLASACGVTFQQVQKYENGLNRVAASRLLAIAAALGVDTASLLGGTADGGDAIALNLVDQRMVRDYLRCSPEHQAAVRQLVKSLRPVK